jgi:hypothetical protein
MGKRTDEELQQLSLKRRQEVADTKATVHRIMSGNYTPEDEDKKPNLKIKPLPHGKFFTAPSPGVGPQVETPALYERTQDIIPTED